MSLSPVIYLCINLPQSEDRRCSISEQAQKIGLDVQFVEAVAGKDLPPHVPDYDREERRKRYSYDLTPNEIACVLSHRKAMCAFLESKAEYAVIMEDDALLDPNIKEGVSEIIQQLHGWEAVKLYEDAECTLYPLENNAEGVLVHAVMPRKLLWGAVGWLYSRSAAKKLVEAMQTFSLAADAQIGHILLEQSIPSMGVTPSLISTSDPHNERSTIDTANCRRSDQERCRGPLQFLRYRWSVIRISCAKKRMFHLMRQRLSRAVSY